MVKQLSVFDIEQPLESPRTQKEHHRWQLFVDGASRNNPGKAGIGIYIVRDNQPYYQNGYFVGIKTNNQAEYLALIVGMLLLRQWVHEDDLIEIRSDSLLVVQQLNGRWSIKHPDLKPLQMLARKLLASYQHTIIHIMREQNSKADAMANVGIDEKRMIEPALHDALAGYGITL